MEKLKSCVFKKDWRYYKTCYECGMLRECKSEYKPNWRWRIIEAVVVWWKRRQIKRHMRRMFKNTKPSQLKGLKRIAREERKAQKISKQS